MRSLVESLNKSFKNVNEAKTFVINDTQIAKLRDEKSPYGLVFFGKKGKINSLDIYFGNLDKIKGYKETPKGKIGICSISEVGSNMAYDEDDEEYNAEPEQDVDMSACSIEELQTIIDKNRADKKYKNKGGYFFTFKDIYEIGEELEAIIEDHNLPIYYDYNLWEEGDLIEDLIVDYM